MTLTKMDKRSLAASAFVRDRPEYSGCFSPTERDMAASFRENSLLYWNRGAIFYGRETNAVPTIYEDTTYDTALLLLKQFHEFENLDYSYCGEFSVDGLRSTLEAQKKAAKAVHRRRVRGKKFWRPYVVWMPGQRSLSFDPDMLSFCCTLLGDERITMWLPVDNVNVRPMRLSNDYGVLYILPIRT